jgi:tripartite-type tricarboxylate transporter receptor subunit TctC
VIDKRSFMLGSAAVAAGLALPRSVQAAAAAPAVKAIPYPHRVVTVVTHSSPGAGSDVLLREMLRYLQRYIDATFIVENDEGGSGAKAVARVSAARPDGSMFYATSPTYVLTSLLSRPARTYRDLEPLVNFFNDSEILYTRTNGPYKTLEDVMNRARATRGRWGAANPASQERQAGEQLKRAASVKAAVVSHEGGGDLMINVLNGTLDMGVGEVQEIRSQLASNRVMMLATFNPERMSAYPNIPTVKELGYDVTVLKFRGLAGPKGMSPDIIRVWEQAVPLILADPEYKVMYTRDNLAPNFMPHDEYGPFVEKFAEETTAYLKSTGVIR